MTSIYTLCRYFSGYVLWLTSILYASSLSIVPIVIHDVVNKSLWLLWQQGLFIVTMVVTIETGSLHGYYGNK